MKILNQIGRDPLTGLLKREDFFARLQDLLNSSIGEVAVVVLDVQNKDANDRALQSLAKIIARPSCTGRYGEKQFILAHCGSAESAKKRAEVLCRQIKQVLDLDVNVGVATARQAKSVISRMVGMADNALGVAKRNGKGRICLAA